MHGGAWWYIVVGVCRQTNIQIGTKVLGFSRFWVSLEEICKVLKGVYILHSAPLIIKIFKTLK